MIRTSDNSLNGRRNLRYTALAFVVALFLGALSFVALANPPADPFPAGVRNSSGPRRLNERQLQTLQESLRQKSGFVELGFNRQIALTIAAASQPTGDNNATGKHEKSLGGAEAAKAIARLGNLTPAAIREQLKQMRKPIYLPGLFLVNKIVEAQHLPIAESKRVDQLKAALQPVLNYHERGKMPIVVLRSEQPKAYLVEGAAIIITTLLMVIATDEEIRGIVAHELAHEYIWAERTEAMKAKDGKLIRECEMFCDAVAAFTLKEIGDEPASYGRIIERLTIVGMNAGSAMKQESDTHPSLDTRKKLIKFLCQRLD